MRTSFVYKTSQLVRISCLINALNKRVLCFFSGKLFYKSKRKRAVLLLCITVLNSPNPSSVYIRLCKHGKRFLLLKFDVVLVY